MRALLLLSLLSANAFAAVDMRDCVDYIRGNTALAPYLPVDDSGRLNRDALDKLVAGGTAKYTLEDGTEIIKTNQGGQTVEIRVLRQSGKLISVSNITTSSRVFGMPGNIPQSFGGSMPFYNPMGIESFPTSTTTTQTTTFRNQNGKCIPEKGTTEEKNSSMNSNTVYRNPNFDIDTCRKLKNFFDQYPNSKVCADSSVGNRLKALLESMPKGSIASENLSTVTGPTYEPGNTWYMAKSKLDDCSSRPGVKAAMNENSIWADERGSASKAGSPDAEK